MNFQLSKEEQYNLLQVEASGFPLQHFFDNYAKELLNVYIIQSSQLVLSEEDVDALKNLIPLLEANFGLVIFTGDRAIATLCNEIGSEYVIYLPTLDEAVEAVYMHELERGFRNELG